eukprot:TRINITY_DN14243_c0_g1_i1.p1 TRINITY_DN14243_c0_g1~~TRINITY_DN14243_c0_g1_i1.p1  ORF type:complete len:431 (+),score=95.00 TRINITY_DN14243_c0_g1_i1:67-1293(+)
MDSLAEAACSVAQQAVSDVEIGVQSSSLVGSKQDDSFATQGSNDCSDDDTSQQRHSAASLSNTASSTNTKESDDEVNGHVMQADPESTLSSTTSDMGVAQQPLLKRPKVCELPVDLAKRLRAINRQAAQRHRQSRKQRYQQLVQQLEHADEQHEELSKQQQDLQQQLGRLKRQVYTLYQTGGVRASWQRFPHQPAPDAGTKRLTLQAGLPPADLTAWAHPSMPSLLARSPMAAGWPSSPAMSSSGAAGIPANGFSFSTSGDADMDRMLKMNMLRVQQAELQLQAARRMQAQVLAQQQQQMGSSRGRRHRQMDNGQTTAPTQIPMLSQQPTTATSSLSAHPPSLDMERYMFWHQQQQLQYHQQQNQMLRQALSLQAMTSDAASTLPGSLPTSTAELAARMFSSAPSNNL